MQPPQGAKAPLSPVLVLISLAVACYPGEITNVQQTDLVTTLYRKDAAWGSFDTIVVLDTVVHIVLEGQEEIEISRDYEPQIIKLVRDGFTDYGYTLIDQDAVAPNDMTRPARAIRRTIVFSSLRTGVRRARRFPDGRGA